MATTTTVRGLHAHAADISESATLTINAARPVTPNEVRQMVKAERIGPGTAVTLRIVGRTAGPRYEHARSLALRYVAAVGGTVENSPPPTPAKAGGSPGRRR